MTRTPLRISFFGGGTDYPEYYSRQPGAVVGAAIDKYIYISALRLTAYQPYNYRVAYSALEFSQKLEEIQHPVVREVLKYYQVTDRLDISVMSDLPSNGSGLGSSSAFTVGFLNLINSMMRRPMTKMDLAREATKVERELLHENVGVQDQLHASFGGINRFDFFEKQIRVTPISISARDLNRINESLVLVHTGIARRATDTVSEQVAATVTGSIDNDLAALYEMVTDCSDILENGGEQMLPNLGHLFCRSWDIKRRLSSKVSNDVIDALYAKVMSAGAYGGKLCGAGGGGFLAMLVPPEKIEHVREVVFPLAVIPTSIDLTGTALVNQSPSVDILKCSRAW